MLQMVAALQQLDMTRCTDDAPFQQNPLFDRCLCLVGHGKSHACSLCQYHPITTIATAMLLLMRRRTEMQAKQIMTKI